MLARESKLGGSSSVASITHAWRAYSASGVPDLRPPRSTAAGSDARRPYNCLINGDHATDDRAPPKHSVLFFDHKIEHEHPRNKHTRNFYTQSLRVDDWEMNGHLNTAVV